MSGPGVGLLVELIKAVARLALPADAQIRQLEKRGLFPSVDELALDLHDGVVLLPQFVANGWITSKDADAIAAIDQMLNRMSGPGNPLWTADALTRAEEWGEVRRQARDALA
jgi:hypothetical protein